jgi:MSHA biogenesis protein MshL
MKGLLRQLVIVLYLSALGGCATGGSHSSVKSQIDSELDAAVTSATTQEQVNNALLPPLPAAPMDNASAEAKFDLAVNNTPAQQVFMAIVSGTRYSMLLHPEVSGNISLNLKDVIVFDALEAIREMYGYEYKVDGTRIYIQPLGLQTRIFHVNYLTGQRDGKSSLRVTSGSVSDSPRTTSTGGTTTTNTGGNQVALDSSKVSMTSSADFWEELTRALTTIVGNEKGRSVVISPMSGVVVVRAMPDELRNVAAYLKASQISVERQVILEAKIVEVQLNDAFQSGVNWGAVKNGANLALFVNGKKVHETFAPAPIPRSVAEDFALGANPHHIGNEFFIGAMDDFAFYAKPLSVEEIEDLYRGNR